MKTLFFLLIVGCNTNSNPDVITRASPVVPEYKIVVPSHSRIQSEVAECYSKINSKGTERLNARIECRVNLSEKYPQANINWITFD